MARKKMNARKTTKEVEVEDVQPEVEKEGEAGEDVEEEMEEEVDEGDDVEEEVEEGEDVDEDVEEEVDEGEDVEEDVEEEVEQGEDVDEEVEEEEVVEEEEEVQEEVEVKAEVSRCRSRSSLHRFYNAIEKMRIADDGQLKRELMRTPFGFLLGCPNIKTNNALLTALLMLWDKQLGGCRICGRLVPFTVEDVAFITGLKMEGRDVDIPKEGSGEEAGEDDERGVDPDEGGGSSCRSNFEISKGNNLTTRVIVEAYLENVGRLPIMDGVSSWVLYVLGAILFPTTNQYLDLRWSRYADTFGDLPSFNWPAAIHESLVKGLDAAKDSIVKRPNAKTTHVRSCVAIFVVSFSPLMSNCYSTLNYAFNIMLKC